MDLHLKQIPAPNEFMYVLGTVYYEICIAYITSYVFYFITIYIPQRRKKILAYGYIQSKIIKINEIDMDFLNAIINGFVFCSDNNAEQVRKINKEDLKIKCKDIDPRESANIFFRFGGMTFKNWFKVFDFVNKLIKENVTDILVFQDCLSMEMISKLADIEVVSADLNRFLGNSINNEDLTVFSRQIWTLHNDINSLSIIFHKNNRDFKNYIKFKKE